MAFPYKNVLIIGATSGLGLALAERMIENGIFVVGVGRRKERLDEFVAKHGSEKAAASQFDITELSGIKGWVESVVKAHPDIDAVVLNSGIQRTIDFTKPNAIDLDLVQTEITTNYTSYISLITHFLPHLQSQAPKPTALIPVSSGLALVPMPRCANYCATKSALHSLCWTLRAQLSQDEASKHIRVTEIIPPAVQTELHTQQKDLVEKGMDKIGISIEEFTDDAWRGLTAGEEEIVVGPIKERFGRVEEGRKQAFQGLLEHVRKGGMA
ncbi:short chain dehydrogenase [Xylariales sp. AK1849]|nr:short chain dehydrogenase [Xylariales sp. AK1849]